MLTLKQFNYLIAIVEEGSFIAASAKLFIAQSALSRQIKNLEDELGFQIFDRSEKGIQLTSAGKVLYKGLKNNLKILNHSILLAQAVSEGRGRVLKMAHSSSIVLDQTKIDMLHHLSQHFEIEINTLSSEQQIESLLDGSIDFGFIRPPVFNVLNELKEVHLYSAPLYVAVNEIEHILREKTSINMQDLNSVQFVSTPHDERGGLSYLAANLCLSHGFKPCNAKIRSRKVSQLQLVAHNFGICIVPEEFKSILPQNVKMIPIEGQYMSEVKLIWRKDDDELINECTKIIQNYYKNTD